MHVVSMVSGVLALVLAALWAVVGTTALTGKLKRNRWFGVRADETMRSADGWALGNKVAAPGFLGAALVLLIGGVLAFGADWGFVLGFGAILVSLPIIAVVAGVGIRAAATVPAQEESAGCTSGCCSGDTDGAAAVDADAEASNAGCADDPAADCGAASCGSCALAGMCTTEQPADSVR